MGRRSSGERFGRALRGYDPVEVDAHVVIAESRIDGLREQVTELQRALTAATAELDRYRAMEEEFTRPVHLAEHLVAEAERQAAGLVGGAHEEAAELVANARREAHQIVTEAREDMAREATQLEGLRLAVAAEAATLSDIEKRLGDRISRAAATLVELIDAPGGLGPFSHATASVVDFARLLHQLTGTMAGTGAVGRVRVELEGDVAIATIEAAPERAPAGAPSSPEPPRIPPPPRRPAFAQLAKAENSSSMALS